MSRIKTIKSHDLGDIVVSTIQNTSNYSNGSMQIAQGMPLPTIIDISAIIQSLVNSAVTVNFAPMNTDQDLTYDWTSDINTFNQGVYWLWGGVTSGGVGLIYGGYNSSLQKHRWAWICSHGYYTSLNNPQKGRYYIQQVWSAWYVPAISGKSVAFCYYDRSYNSTSLIAPFPEHNFYQNVIILQPTDPNQSTVEGTYLRKKRRIGPSGTPENVGYDFAETEVTTLQDALDPSGIYWQSIPYNVRGWYPDAIVTTPTTLWSGSYASQAILDDDYYGYSGYNHESGHWYGFEEDDDDDEGGDGDGDNQQVPIPPANSSDIPTNILDTGFFTLFKPVSAELRGLANFMFAQLTDGDAEALKKLLVNPLDYITCLNACHFPIPTGDHAEIKVGGIGTTVQAALVTNQFVTLSGGSIAINEYWGNYLDYAPYTQVKIHIPYCGTHDLDVDMVMHSTLKLQYDIDLLSGSMVATLYIDKPNDLVNQPDAINNSVIETYTGNVFSPIPIASSDYRNMLGSVLGIASSAVSSLVSGSPLPLANGVANAVTNSKSTVTKQGSVSNSYGYISPQEAFLIISRPCLAMKDTEKDKFHDWLGYPCNMVKAVGDFSGVLTIQKGTFWSGDNTNNFDSITDAEKEELEQIMEGGICV